MSLNRTGPYERINESDSDDVCLYAYITKTDSYIINSTNTFKHSLPGSDMNKIIFTPPPPKKWRETHHFH